MFEIAGTGGDAETIGSEERGLRRNVRTRDYYIHCIDAFEREHE